MSSWKRRNRRRRTSLKELGPRRRLGVTVKVIDKSEVRFLPSETRTGPDIELIRDKSVAHQPLTALFALRGPSFVKQGS